MAHALFQLTTLERFCNDDNFSAANKDKSKKATEGRSIFPVITQCTFRQVDQTAVSVIVRSDNFITLIVEESKKPSSKKSIQWFISPGKNIKAICLINSCIWAVLVTADACLYILPVLPLISSTWSESFFASKGNYSTTDITTILLKRPKNTKPTSVVCWQSKCTNGDVAVVGTEDGEVVFVDMKSLQEVIRVRIGDAILSLEVVHHGKSLTYLLISTISNNQFGLLLEQSNGTDYLSNSMEAMASNMNFTLVQASEAVNSILASEANDLMFRPLRFQQFMRTAHLSTQVVKCNSLIVAHCLSSNILKVYDSSLDSWLTLFVYNIPISSDRVLLTDHFIFALTKVSKMKLTSVTVLSSKLSETSGIEHSSNAKIQTLLLPTGEQVIGIYRRLFPTLKQGEADEGHDDAIGHTSSLVDGCIIFTDKAIYQIKPQLDFDDYFLELLSEGSNKKAENLGMTLDLNMSLLFMRASEQNLQQSQLQEAVKLFRLSRSSSLDWVHLLTKYNYLQEALSVIEGALNKQGEVGNADCRKLANIAIKCHVCLIHKSNGSKESLSHLNTFLADNFDYNEVTAVSLLGEHALWEPMLEMAKTKGYLMVAMETLLDNFPVPINSALLKKLKSPAYLSAFVTARDCGFINKLPRLEVISLLLSKTDLVFKHLPFIGQCLPLLSIRKLLRLAVVLDPTKPMMRSLFETNRGRSVSSSSLKSLDSFYGLELDSENIILPETSALVQSFICVLIELHSRRCQDEYDNILEPTLAEIDKNHHAYHHGNDTPAVFSQKAQIKRNLISCGRHHTGLISSGELYTWGNATSGRLGHGSIIPVEGFSPPLRVEILHMHHLQVLSVSCGNKHTLALTSMDRLYAWGSSTYGQIGTGDRKMHTHPILVEEIQGRGCVEIACGQYHCLARTQNNRVWSWGWGVHGQLGHGDVEDGLVPRVIGALLDEDVIQMGAGACHSGSLTADGKVWLFGSGAFGQLGSEDVYKSSVPLLLTGLAEIPITNLACGYYHNLAVTATEPQRLYIWGKSPIEIKMNLQISRKLRTHIKKGKRHCQDLVHPLAGNYMKPELILTDHLPSPIRKMVCSCTHNILLTESSNVFTWGRNDMGQLGNPSHKNFIDRPSPILVNQTFADISSGLEFSTAVNHYGVVFSWGSAEADQLGYSVHLQSLLMPGHSSPSVATPRKVPNVPLITVPAELLQTHREEDSPKQNTEEKVLPNFSMTVIDHLLKDFPNSSLALPLKGNPAQPCYSRPSLLAVLKHLRAYYQLSAVLKECTDRHLWALASEVALVFGDFAHALFCRMEAMKEGSLSLENTLLTLNSFLILLSQKVSVGRIDSHQKSLQMIIIKVFSFWNEQGYAVSELEPLLQTHLNLLAYPLSVLLFSPRVTETAGVSEHRQLMDKYQTSFSTKLCLMITSAAVGVIQNTAPRREIEIDINCLSSNVPTSPVKHITEKLTAELIQINSCYGNEGLMLTPDELNKDITFTNLPAGGSETCRVVFTCGHCYRSSAFYNEEVTKIQNKFQDFSNKMPKTCQILETLYDYESGVISSACPQCAMEYLYVSGH